MDTKDPTTPYYEREKLIENSEIAMVVREILRFIRQTNPLSMNGWSADDTNDLMKHVQDEGYTAKQLSVAFNRLKSAAQTKLIDFSVFYQIIGEVTRHWEMYKPNDSIGSSYDDWREQELQKFMRTPEQVERQKNAPKGDSKAIAAYWLKHIHEDLKKLVAPLPYDKNVRDRG